MKSMPPQSPFARAALPSAPAPQGFLGRGTLGERPRAPPMMTTHKLTSQAQFVVSHDASVTCHNASVSCQLAGTVLPSAPAPQGFPGKGNLGTPQGTAHDDH